MLRHGHHWRLFSQTGRLRQTSIKDAEDVTYTGRMYTLIERLGSERGGDPTGGRMALWVRVCQVWQSP